MGNKVPVSSGDTIVKDNGRDGEGACYRTLASLSVSWSLFKNEAFRTLYRRPAP